MTIYLNFVGIRKTTFRTISLIIVGMLCCSTYAHTTVCHAYPSTAGGSAYERIAADPRDYTTCWHGDGITPMMVSSFSPSLFCGGAKLELVCYMPPCSSIPTGEFPSIVTDVTQRIKCPSSHPCLAMSLINRDFFFTCHVDYTLTYAYIPAPPSNICPARTTITNFPRNLYLDQTHRSGYCNNGFPGYKFQYVLTSYTGPGVINYMCSRGLTNTLSGVGDMGRCPESEGFTATLSGGSSSTNIASEVHCYKDFTPHFRKITDKYGDCIDFDLGIDGRTSHNPEEYYIWILEKLAYIDKMADGDCAKFQEICKNKIVNVLRDNPQIWQKI